MNSFHCLLLWIKSSRSAKSSWKLVETRLSPHSSPLLCLCPAILSLLKWNKMKWREGRGVYTEGWKWKGRGKIEGKQGDIVRGKGREEKTREQIGGGGTKASASNSVFTRRDRKTVEIVVATLVVPLVPRVLICIPLRPTCALNFSTLTAESTRNAKPCSFNFNRNIMIRGWPPPVSSSLWEYEHVRMFLSWSRVLWTTWVGNEVTFRRRICSLLEAAMDFVDIYFLKYL